ncbi:MAG: HDOD domain-containing protein [Planctomycetes bacterium]|nr:HDOD domain-containing protein [Planctomycetota bacterium]
MSASTELSLEVHEALARYLDEHLELPVLPEAAARILSLCEDPETESQDIVAALERDPSLASHVLRLANSAVFAPVEPIVSLKQAVGRLGMTMIRNLSIAVTLQGRVFCSRQHEEHTRAMWAHCALTAVFAREVARRLRRNGEVAFLWGLMHDVGRPIVFQAAVERPELLGCDPAGGALLEAAMDTFHARVGARLVHAWGLPYPIEVVVACHHEPSAASEYAPDARLTRLADLLAHWALEDALEPEDFPRDEPVVVELGLGEEALSELLALRQQAIGYALSLR